MVRGPAPDGQFVFGNLVVDLDTYGVSVNDDPVELTFSEFELLRRFCEEPDKILDYESLCSAVWKATGPIFKRRLAVAICRIRSKLGELDSYRLETVRGRGYGLVRRRERKTSHV
jgi:DNA-binding response OmpR family regulator